MPYFHEISHADWNAMKKRGVTWAEVRDEYDAPEWCGYGKQAVHPMGCWSLVGRMVTGIDYCRRCEAFLGASAKS